MKPRELILCALLLSGGTAVVAVGWHLLSAPTPPATAPAKVTVVKPPSTSSDFKIPKQSASRSTKKTTPKPAVSGTAEAVAEPELPFNEAVQAAMAEEDKGTLFKNLLEIVKKLDLKQIPDALKFAGTLEGRERDMMQRLVTGRWGALDPMAAIAYAKQSPDKNTSADLLRSVIFGWSNSNPTGALSYIQSQPAGADRTQNMQIAMSMWARNDPQAAANYVTSLPAADQVGAVSRIAGSWASSNPAAALQWAGSLTSEDAKGKAYQGVMYTWAHNDAAGASTWLQSLPQGTARDQAVSSFTAIVANNDPQSAVTWAQTIADPKTRTADLERIAGTWLRRDPASAEQWLTQTNSLAPDVKTRVLKSSNATSQGGSGFGGFGKNRGPGQ